MDVATDEPDRDLGVARALRRRWPTIVVFTVLFAVLGVGVALLRGSTHQASATVLIRALEGNAYSTTATSNTQTAIVALQTEANIVDSAAVTKLVNARLHTHLTPRTAHVIATVPTNTQLVRVSATANSDKAAKQRAEAYATGYLKYRGVLAKSTINAQLSNLNAQARSAGKALQAATLAARSSRPPADATAKVQLASSRLSSIQSQISQAQSVAVQPGTIVRSAAAQPASRLKTWLAPVVGLVIGFLLGTLVAWWRERRDDRIRSAGQHSIGDVAVLATLPRPEADADPQRDIAVRTARTSVLASAPPPCVLGIAPLVEAEGDAAARFAVALARSLRAAGYRVCVVDAVIDDPRLAGLLDLDADTTGLADVLLAEADRPVEPVEADDILALPAGADPASARDRYAGTAVSRVLSATSALVDYTLVIGAPLDADDSVGVLHAIAGAMVLVADGRNTHAELARVAAAASRFDVALLGAVVLSQPRRGRKAGTRRAAERPQPQPAQSSAPDTASEGDEPARDAQRSGSVATTASTSADVDGGVATSITWGPVTPVQAASDRAEDDDAATADLRIPDENHAEPVENKVEAGGAPPDGPVVRESASSDEDAADDGLRAGDSPANGRNGYHSVVLAEADEHRPAAAADPGREAPAAADEANADPDEGTPAAEISSTIRRHGARRQRTRSNTRRQ